MTIITSITIMTIITIVTIMTKVTIRTIMTTMAIMTRMGGRAWDIYPWEDGVSLRFLSLTRNRKMDHDRGRYFGEYPIPEYPCESSDDHTTQVRGLE